MKKKSIHTIIAVLLVAPFVIPTSVWAGPKDRNRSGYHHGQKHKKRVRQPRKTVRHKHEKRVRHARKRVRAKHRRVHRRYYRPRVVSRHYYPRYVRPHYHVGFYDPCYDPYHTHGVSWDLNVSNHGWGFGVHID